MKIKTYLCSSSHQIKPFTFIFSVKIRSISLNTWVSYMFSSSSLFNYISPDWAQKRYFYLLIRALTNLPCTASLWKYVCCYKKPALENDFVSGELHFSDDNKQLSQVKPSANLSLEYPKGDGFHIPLSAASEKSQTNVRGFGSH